MQIFNRLRDHYIVVQYHNDRNISHDTILVFNINNRRTAFQLKITYCHQTYFLTRIPIKKFFKYTKQDLMTLINRIEHDKTDDSQEIMIIDHGIKMIKVSIVEIQRIMYTYFKSHPLPNAKI